MRPTYTQDQIEERYQKLPDALKQALFAPDVAEKMFAIGKKYGLTIAKIGLSADEVGAVILGFTKPNNFVGYLAEALGIEDTKTGEIAADINREILHPLREELKKTHDVDFSMDALHPSFMAPSRGSVSPPATAVKPPPVIMPKNFPAAAPSTGAPSSVFAQKSSLSGSATPTPLSSPLTRPTPPYPPSKSGTISPPTSAEKITIPLSSKATEEELPPPPRIISPGLDKKSSIADAFKKSSWIMPQKTPEPEKKSVPSFSPAPIIDTKKQDIPTPMSVRTQTEFTQKPTSVSETSLHNNNEVVPPSSVSPPLLEKKMPSLPRYTPPTPPKPIDLRNLASPPTPSSSPISKPISSLVPTAPTQPAKIPTEEIPTTHGTPLPKAPSQKNSVPIQKEHTIQQLSRNENDPYREPVE